MHRLLMFAAVLGCAPRVVRPPASATATLTKLLVAMAATTPPPTPEELAPGWVELTSPHFLFRTDAPIDDAPEILDQLEHDYRLLGAVMKADYPGFGAPTERIAFALFSSRTEYAALHPHFDGFFELNTRMWDPRPTITMRGPISGLRARLARHELAHYFIHYYLPQAPSWLNEGLAEYYSTVVRDGDRAELGRAIVPHLGAPPKVRQLLVATTESFGKNEAHYDRAWTLVRLLAGGYPPRFHAYLERLADGEPNDAAEAELAGLDLDRLDAECDVWRLAPPALRWLAIGPDAPIARVQDRPRRLTPAEVLLLHAELVPWTDEQRPIAEHDVARAHALAPDSLDVRYWAASLVRAQGRLTDARALLEAALADAPEDPRLLEGILKGKQSSELAERLAPRAETAEQLYLVAFFYVHAARFSEGLPFARRAALMRREHAQSWDVLAAALFGVQLLDEAIEAERHAVRVAPGRAELAWQLEFYLQAKARAAPHGRQ